MTPVLLCPDYSKPSALTVLCHLLTLQCFLLACACAFLILKANDSCVLNFQTSGLVYVLTIDMCVYSQVTSSCKMSWLVSLALNQLFKIISLEMKCRCIDKECQTIAEAVDAPLSQFSTVLKMGQIFLPAVPPNIRFRF
jgi:hypothetical protein